MFNLNSSPIVEMSKAITTIYAMDKDLFILMQTAVRDGNVKISCIKYLRSKIVGLHLLTAKIMVEAIMDGNFAQSQTAQIKVHIERSPDLHCSYHTILVTEPSDRPTD